MCLLVKESKPRFHAHAKACIGIGVCAALLSACLLHLQTLTCIGLNERADGAAKPRKLIWLTNDMEFGCRRKSMHVPNRTGGSPHAKSAAALFSSQQYQLLQNPDIVQCNEATRSCSEWREYEWQPRKGTQALQQTRNTRAITEKTSPSLNWTAKSAND